MATTSPDPVAPATAPAPREWFLTGAELDATSAKIAGLQRRAARKGFTGRLELHAEPATRRHTPAPGAPPVVTHGYTVTITGEPPAYAGWRFLAAVDTLHAPTDGNSEGQPSAARARLLVLRYPPGADPLTDTSWLTPGECDHCHTTRPRASTYLVQHTETGELRQVGRSCLQDFLGHNTLPVFIDTPQLDDSIDRALGSRHDTTPWDVTSVLTYAWAIIETHGWHPATSTPSTKDMVADALTGTSRTSGDLLASITGQLPDAHRLAPRIRTELTRRLTGHTSYEANLLAILGSGQVDRRKHLGLAVSAIIAWQRLDQPSPPPTEQVPPRSISYAGQVGQPITLTGTITTIVAVEGYRYDSPPQRLLIIDTGDHVAKTVTSAAWAFQVQRGDTVAVRGTVKAHAEYRDVPQTVLVRPRRLDPPTVPASTDPLWETVAPVPPQSRFQAAPLAAAAPPAPGLALPTQKEPLMTTDETLDRPGPPLRKQLLSLPFGVDVVFVPPSLGAALADAIATDHTRPEAQEGADND